LGDIVADRVVGADGCRGGWLAVAMPPGDPAAATAQIVAQAADLLALGDPVAIDIPIGLMDGPADGPRPPDSTARRFLSELNRDRVVGVGSRVFASPTREHLAIIAAGGTYRDLLGHFRPGRHISKQCFMISPRIIELDALCRADPDAGIWESHPEISFALHAGRTLPSKHRREGLSLRRRLLTDAGFDIDQLGGALPDRPGLWSPDDLLDAVMLAVTAERVALGTHAGLPNLTDRDSLGLRRAIVY